MKKPLHYILSLAAGTAAIVFAINSGSSAQQAQPGPVEQKTTMERQTSTPPQNLRVVTLTVKEVDRAAHKVTFEAHVKPEANITKNGQPIRLDELQKGESLKVTIDPATGEVIKAEVTRKVEQ